MENEEIGQLYLIAANSKRAQLIFNIFRPIDLGIAITGASVTIILFIALSSFINLNIWTSILVLMPFFVCAFLVLPIPNYQNVLCILINVFRFYFEERQQFKWKGWCAKDEFKD